MTELKELSKRNNKPIYEYKIEKDFIVIYKNNKYFDEVDIDTLVEIYIDEKYGWRQI